MSSYPLDISGTVVGESPDCLLLSGTVVGENPDYVCWVSLSFYDHKPSIITIIESNEDIPCLWCCSQTERIYVQHWIFPESMNEWQLFQHSILWPVDYIFGSGVLTSLDLVACPGCSEKNNLHIVFPLNVVTFLSDNFCPKTSLDINKGIIFLDHYRQKCTLGYIIISLLRQWLFKANIFPRFNMMD